MEKTIADQENILLQIHSLLMEKTQKTIGFFIKSPPRKNLSAQAIFDKVKTNLVIPSKMQLIQADKLRNNNWKFIYNIMECSEEELSKIPRNPVFVAGLKIERFREGKIDFNSTIIKFLNVQTNKVWKDDSLIELVRKLAKSYGDVEKVEFIHGSPNSFNVFYNKFPIDLIGVSRIQTRNKDPICLIRSNSNLCSKCKCAGHFPKYCPFTNEKDVPTIVKERLLNESNRRNYEKEKSNKKQHQQKGKSPYPRNRNDYTNKQRSTDSKSRNASQQQKSNKNSSQQPSSNYWRPRKNDGKEEANNKNDPKNVSSSSTDPKPQGIDTTTSPSCTDVEMNYHDTTATSTPNSTSTSNSTSTPNSKKVTTPNSTNSSSSTNLKSTNSTETPIPKGPVRQVVLLKKRSVSLSSPFQTSILNYVHGDTPDKRKLDDLDNHSTGLTPPNKYLKSQSNNEENEEKSPEILSGNKA